jgi:hypothetical protein
MRAMPREDRRIFFDYEETYKAIVALCNEKGLPKPASGYIMNVEYHPENPLEIDITLENNRSGSVEYVRYTKDFMVAALMGSCRVIGIPLPKAANKTMEIHDEKLALRVQMLR